MVSGSAATPDQAEDSPLVMESAGWKRCAGKLRFRWLPFPTAGKRDWMRAGGASRLNPKPEDNHFSREVVALSRGAVH